MVTIQFTPPETLFAGNPALFGIHTNNMLPTPGAKCVFMLVVTQADTVAGHTLNFVFSNKTLTFTTAASPDDSGLQIPVAASSGAFATWCQTLYDCFLSNFYITTLFDLAIADATSVSRIISFTAKNKGVYSMPSVTSSLITVTLLPWITGVDPVSRSNFNIIGGIWDKNFKQIAQDAKPVDGDGNAVFNFTEYLSALLDYDDSPHFTYPFDPSENIKTFKNYVLEFYTGFAEKFDGVVQKIHYDSLRNALSGGLNRESLVFYNDHGSDFFSTPANLKTFMTWAPLVKTSGKQVPEKLFFYVSNKPSYSFVVLMVFVYFTDGTDDFMNCGQYELLANDVIECSVGYEQLGFATNFPTKTVSYWDVWLAVEGEDVYTETRRFILDPVLYENERVFLFQNSWGRAYDVVRFTGRGIVGLTLDSSTGSSQSLEQYTSFNAPSRKFESSETQGMKTNSGWVSREMKDFFREMLLSRQVFELKDNLLYPIVITNQSIKEHFIDNEYLYSLDLEYDRAYRDFFFSRFNVGLFPVLVRFYCDDYEDNYS